jgi:uncharacterized damage-inducible protein DinB
MLSHWIKRFQYNYWANKQVLDALDEQGVQSEEIIRQLNHLFAVELMWFERIADHESDRNPHNPQHTRACRALMRESQERYATMLHQLDDEQLTTARTYYNTKGEEYHDSLIDLLDHVLNHSEHHRAQIVRHMRSLDYEPPVTDYIFYLREN